MLFLFLFSILAYICFNCFRSFELICMQYSDAGLDLLPYMVTNLGHSVGALSKEQPVMLVFLRHFGCIFCREALADISRQREHIESGGIKIIFVHMAAGEEAEKYFEKYQLSGLEHISDPECRFYQGFGLVKGNFRQLFGLQTWIRGFSAVTEGHSAGAQLGDGFQMPGVFIVQNGEIQEQFIHKLASDRPDYLDLASCCSVQ